jgi:hypothetical protein
MVKVRSNYPNNGINLSSEENDLNFNSDTEKCLNTSTPSGKLRFIILCACLTILAFAVGLVIGFFTKNETCANNETVVNHRRDHTTNRQTFLNVLNKEEIRRNIRYGLNFIEDSACSLYITIVLISISDSFRWSVSLHYLCISLIIKV